MNDDMQFQDLNEMRQWEQQCLEKFGFYAHYVTDDKSTPTGINYHTHGLQSYNHPDFQIVVPVPASVAHSIISDLVSRVKEGKHYKTGFRYKGIIRKYPIKFISVADGERSVLRVIFPDPTGELSKTKMKDELYKLQFSGAGIH